MTAVAEQLPLGEAGASARPIKMLMTGQMGSGKSFISSHLTREHDAMRWSRTELMKRLAHAVVDHLGDVDSILVKLFADEDERNEVRDELLAYAETYAGEPGKPRRLYQDITQICQDHDPLCFERELAARIDAVGTCEFSLIDDVRSPEAFQFFADLGYVTVRVAAAERVRRQRMLDRDGYLPSPETFSHPSETALNAIPHDHTVDNSGDDAAELYGRVDELVSYLRRS